MFAQLINKENIEKIKNNDFTKKRIQTVIADTDKYIDLKIPAVSYSDFMLFYKTGNRKKYEDEYFLKRNILNHSAVAYIFTREEKYKRLLQDVIWAICDEFTWAFPAHINMSVDFEAKRRFLDLFACETAQSLSEIYTILKDELDDIVKKRIEDEVRYRTIDSYLNKVQGVPWWENGTNNWSAVCGGCIGMTFIYMAKEEETKIAIKRLSKTLECFLFGFSKDGCCVEGLSYWNYGFGFFVYYADLLCEYSKGEINPFDSKKVHDIALFQQNMILDKTKCVGFSDGKETFDFSVGLTYYLKNKYDDVVIPNSSLSNLSFVETRWCKFVRDIFWYDEKLELSENQKENFKFYDDVQWYLKTTGKYAFCAKGGNNDESHNHNDLGSFQLVVNDNLIFSDFGSSEYTQQYFSKERYDYFVTSSLGHSVPIVDKGYAYNDKKYEKKATIDVKLIHKYSILTGTQLCGKDRCAKIIGADDKHFAIEFANAYGNDNLKALTREFVLDNEVITINDKYEFEALAKNVTERFVTRFLPKIEADGEVKINNSVLMYDKDKLECKITPQHYSHHETTEDVTVYSIDFEVKALTKEINLKFIIK